MYDYSFDIQLQSFQHANWIVLSFGLVSQNDLRNQMCSKRSNFNHFICYTQNC